MKIMFHSRLKTGLYILSIIFFSSNTLGSEAYLHKAEKNNSRYTSNNLLLASNKLISAEQAANIAKQGQASKVLKISKKTTDNSDLYQIKLLTPKGHVRLVLVDARTGEIVHGNK